MCTEAAHLLVRVPGPFHAFFLRLRRRKPYNVAITAVSRKLVVLIWHMLTKNEAYRYASPDLTREKLNRMNRLATGKRSPRKPRGHTGPRHQPGQDGEDEYEHFIHDRFGSQGPENVDHPNRHKHKH